MKSPPDQQDNRIMDTLFWGSLTKEELYPTKSFQNNRIIARRQLLLSTLQLDLAQLELDAVASWLKLLSLTDKGSLRPEA